MESDIVQQVAVVMLHIEQITKAIEVWMRKWSGDVNTGYRSFSRSLRQAADAVEVTYVIGHVSFTG